MISIFLLCVQFSLLYFMCKSAAVNSTRVVYRFANPYCWLAGMYFLWFLVPQIFGLIMGYYILGMDASTPSQARDDFITVQIWLCVFLFSISLTGYVMNLFASRKSGERTVRRMLRLDFTLSHSIYLYSFFLLGLAASLYVATLNLNITGGFRSEIVKSLPGRIATAVSYLGAFSFAYLSIRCYARRQWFVLLVIILLFVSGVILTGARGRLLWPIAILLLYIACRRDSFNASKVLLLSLSGVLLLLTIDPVIKILKEGVNSQVFSLDTFFAPLIFRRNFDGFANFAIISSYDVVRHDFTYLLTGARDIFMATYHAKFYLIGLGFGSTIPGWLWIAGGPLVLILGGMVYGIFLSLLNRWLRENSSNLLFWAYLFAMPWLCAVGGNLMESIDKMLVAVFGPVFLHYLELLKPKRRVSQPV